ncbi:hypothetical protein [Sinosporangium album]|uniref:hypothetical protein n=1 Tax=Sinosporangium album TaxID=504805 RepID=UPI000B841467|nr:hypothetical protein [Sinosporangium album]
MLKAQVHALADLPRWAARRADVATGDTAAGYAAQQRMVMFIFAGVLAVETVALEVLLQAFDVPLWIRLIVLVLDVAGVVGVLATIAACEVRPHVVGADGLLVRYGTLFELRVPYTLVAGARIDHRFNEEGTVRLAPGALHVAVSSQTNVVVTLTDEIEVPGRGRAKAVRLFADDPAATVAAVQRALRKQPRKQPREQLREHENQTGADPL